MDKGHRLDVRSQHWEWGMEESGDGLGQKWMGREHMLLPADTLRLSASTPCG